MEGEAVGVHHSGIEATLLGRGDHVGRCVHADNLRSRGGDSFRERPVTAAQIQNALPRLRIEQIKHRLPQVGHEPRILGVAG